MLAVRELLAGKIKFGLMAVAIGLVVALTLLMSAMSEGLITGMTGAKRSLDADALVYQGDVSLALERSVLSAEDLGLVSAAAGVRDVYAVGHVVVTVAGPDGPFDAHVFGLGGGFEQLPVIEGGPVPPGAGEAVVDSSAVAEGLEPGDSLTLEPAGLTLRVVALTEHRRYIMAPVIYTDLPTWSAIRQETLLARDAGDAPAPDLASAEETGAAGGPSLRVPEAAAASIAAVRLEPGASVDALAAALGDRFDVATPEEASMAGNGMSVMVLAVDGIQVVSLVIGAVVIGVFFYITTLHKSGQFAALKALGASNLFLYRQLLLQITLLVALAALLGIALALGAGSGMPPAMAFDPDAGRWGLSLLAVFLTAYAGSLFSLRSILQVDPATALDRAEH